MEVKKVVEEWGIWDEEEEVARLEEKAKKMVPDVMERFGPNILFFLLSIFLFL